MAQAITSARQAAEWGMRAIQGTFGRLHTTLTADETRRRTILTCIMHLHNYQTRLVGMNQITSVYVDRTMLQHKLNRV